MSIIPPMIRSRSRSATSSCSGLTRCMVRSRSPIGRGRWRSSRMRRILRRTSVGSTVMAEKGPPDGFVLEAQIRAVVLVAVEGAEALRRERARSRLVQRDAVLEDLLQEQGIGAGEVD